MRNNDLSLENIIFIVLNTISAGCISGVADNEE
jgi:hypothetical protein